MKKEIFESVIRALVQLAGVLVALNVAIPFLPEALDALNYIAEKLDSSWAALNEIIGVVVALIGFFYKKDRFEERSIGQQVKSKALQKGISVSKLIHDIG